MREVFRQSLDAVQEAVVLISKKNRIMAHVNQGAARLFSNTTGPEDLQGMPLVYLPGPARQVYNPGSWT